MTLESRAIEVLTAWYNGLKLHRDRLPAKGAVSAALVILDRLQHDFDLDSHLADGGGATEGHFREVGLNDHGSTW